MKIEELKKELGLTNSELAGFFALTPISYANSSAKKRYENALIRFYEKVKEVQSNENWNDEIN